MRSQMRTLFIGSLLAFSLSALASPLDDARNAGHAIEVPTGYVQATPTAPPEVKVLVAEINQRRLAAYAQIAKKNGITTEQVAAESYRQRSKIN